MLKSPHGRRRASALALLLCLALGAGCERHRAGAPARSVAELELNLARAGRIELYVLEERLVELARVGARTLAARTGLEVELLGPGDASRGGARFVIGDLERPELAELLAALGAERREERGELVYQGVALDGAGDLVAASFQDPRRPGLPVALLAAGSASTLEPLLADLRFPPRPAARVYAAGEAQLELALGLDGAARPASAVHVGDRRRAHVRGFRGLGTNDRSLAVRRGPDVAPAMAARYLDEVQRARARVAEWVGVEELPNLALLVASEPEELLALTGEVALSAPSGLTGTVAALVTRDVPHDSGAGAARETLLAALGAPRAPWLLDGAAIDAAGAWWGRPITEPSAPLPPISVLVDPAAVDRLSMHVLAPARGLLFRFLRKQLGPERLRAAWRGEDLAPQELAALEAEFRAFAGAPRAPAPRAAREAGAFWEGLAIDSRLAPGGALATRRIEHALGAAEAVGADAVSFTSYALARPSEPFAPGGRLPYGLESVEGDAALAAAIAVARRRGMRTVALQPHVLGEESGGSWAWRRRTRSADWDEFFARFQPWLVHYALLAEHTAVDLLCIGTDIVPPVERTGIAEDVRAHFAALWSGAIGAAREVYGGLLTYAARWPNEADVVPFWQELDLVGFSAFPQLGETPATSDAAAVAVLGWQLEQRLAEMAAFAAEAGRPAVVMELGFRSTRGATREAELGPGPIDLDQQRIAYEGLARALPGAREAQPGLAGLFLWSWAVDPLAESGAARSFSPRNKPAQAALRELYR